MDHDSTLWPMIILMVVFSYIVMSNVMLTFRNGVYNHINKAYMALLMGSLMGVIHYIIILWSGHGGIDAWYGLLLWTIISLIFIVLIRQQLLISDKEFLRSMTEHHDMALLMSERIVQKTTDPELKAFAQNIIRTQQSEINYMKQKLEK